MIMKINKTSTCINKEQCRCDKYVTFICRYHVIFCPKYRRKVLNEGRDEYLKGLMIKTAKRHDFDILEMEVMPDYVHLLIDCNPSYGIMQCVRDIKRESAHAMRQAFPELKSRLPNMWTRNCFINSVGVASVAAMEKYVEDQKGK